MALTYKTRRRLALLVLCVGLPAYIVVAVSLVALIDRPSCGSCHCGPFFWASASPTQVQRLKTNRNDL